MCDIIINDDSSYIAYVIEIIFISFYNDKHIILLYKNIDSHLTVTQFWTLVVVLTSSLIKTMTNL